MASVVSKRREKPLVQTILLPRGLKVSARCNSKQFSKKSWLRLDCFTHRPCLKQHLAQPYPLLLTVKFVVAHFGLNWHFGCRKKIPNRCYHALFLGPKYSKMFLRPAPPPRAPLESLQRCPHLHFISDCFAADSRKKIWQRRIETEKGGRERKRRGKWSIPSGWTGSTCVGGSVLSSICVAVPRTDCMVAAAICCTRIIHSR